MRFFAFISIFASLALAEQAGTGLQISASADIGAQFGLHDGSGATERIDVREAEFTLYAPVDHLFDAMVSFAAHKEAGTGIPQAELHEAFIGSTKLIPRSRFRVGQFFLGFGRLNQFHRHDWPFISTPRVQREMFLSQEGALDTGIEYSYLLPLPFFLEVTAGITNGWTFGHDHEEGTKPLLPTHYLRLTNYLDELWGGGVQIGLNYVGRTPSDGTKMTLLGIDITGKWKEGAILQYFIQSEIWYKIQSPRGELTQRDFGFYVFPQYYLGENVFAGLRLDYFSRLANPDGTGATQKNFELRMIPTITYKPSEFSLFRFAYNHTFNYLVDKFTDSQKIIELQAVFILGSHPAHDF